MSYFKGKKVLVTGGAGFLGCPLTARLNALGAEVFVPRSRDCDLRTEEAVRQLFGHFPAHIVIHAAAHGGGIGYLRTRPGEVFYDNGMMNLLVTEYARRTKVEKFVGIGTVCSYPKILPLPFREDDLWMGYPEETNASYGLAKKMMLVQTQGYREQYGFPGVHLLLSNLYGPADDFSLDASHALAAFVRRCVEAKELDEKEIVCWGDGSPTREFLYVDDAVEAIVLAAERCSVSEPINVGTGVETSIKGLVNLIAKCVGYEGRIGWDDSKPNGQPRRCLDTNRALQSFGFRARVSLEEGLQKTINWYCQERGGSFS